MNNKEFDKFATLAQELISTDEIKDLNIKGIDALNFKISENRDGEPLLIAYSGEEESSEIGHADIFYGNIELIDGEGYTAPDNSPEDTVKKFTEMLLDKYMEAEEIEFAYSLMDYANIENVVFDKKDDYIVAYISSEDENKEIGRANVNEGSVELADGSRYISHDMSRMDVIVKFADMIVKAYLQQEKTKMENLAHMIEKNKKSNDGYQK